MRVCVCVCSGVVFSWQLGTSKGITLGYPTRTQLGTLSIWFDTAIGATVLSLENISVEIGANITAS